MEEEEGTEEEEENEEGGMPISSVVTRMPDGGSPFGPGTSRYWARFISEEFEARLLHFCKTEVRFQLYKMNRTKNRQGGRNPGGWRHIGPKSEFYTLTVDRLRGVYYWKQSDDFYQAGWPMPPILTELCELIDEAFGLTGDDRLNSIMIIINEGGTPIENDGFSEPFAHCAPLHMDKHRNSFFFDLSLGYAREMVLTSTDVAHKIDDEEIIFTQSPKGRVANYVVGRQHLASASLGFISAADNRVYKHGVRAEPNQPVEEPRFSIVGRVKTKHPKGHQQGEHFAPIDPAAVARVRPGGDLWKEYVPRFRETVATAMRSIPPPTLSSFDLFTPTIVRTDHSPNLQACSLAHLN